ncbi:hypothetical protein [Niallia sp. 03133]|uniref:hypothetical protein n=1 Tax=Niallia sp. 03133 TaxID=3458060 RepID=UPI004045142D
MVTRKTIRKKNILYYRGMGAKRNMVKERMFAAISVDLQTVTLKIYDMRLEGGY